MTRVRTPWTPPNTDNGGNVQAGVALQPDVDISVSGVWWFQRTSGPATVRASLWNASGSTNLADSGSVSTAGFAAEAWNLISFGSPVTLAGGGTYAAAVLVVSAAAVGYDGDDLTGAVTSADGHVTFPAGGGRFEFSFVYPSSTWSGMHAVDVEYSLAASIAPAGIAVPVALGAPALADGSMAPAPIGISVPVALGSPALTWSGSISPGGLSVPVALGGPTAGDPPTTGVMAPLARTGPTAGSAHRAGPTMSGG